MKYMRQVLHTWGVLLPKWSSRSWTFLSTTLASFCRVWRPRISESASAAQVSIGRAMVKRVIICSNNMIATLCLVFFARVLVSVEQKMSRNIQNVCYTFLVSNRLTNQFTYPSSLDYISFKVDVNKCGSFRQSIPFLWYLRRRVEIRGCKVETFVFTPDQKMRYHFEWRIKNW